MERLLVDAASYLSVATFACFNAATAFGPWRTTVTAGFLHDCQKFWSLMLQCGHGLRAVENRPERAGEHLFHGARSLLQCGHGLRAVENFDHALNAVSAPSIEASMACSLRAVEGHTTEAELLTICGMLQCGHGLRAVENEGELSRRA